MWTNRLGSPPPLYPDESNSQERHQSCPKWHGWLDDEVSQGVGVWAGVVVACILLEMVNLYKDLASVGMNIVVQPLLPFKGMDNTTHRLCRCHCVSSKFLSNLKIFLNSIVWLNWPSSILTIVLVSYLHSIPGRCSTRLCQCYVICDLISVILHNRAKAPDNFLSEGGF